MKYTLKIALCLCISVAGVRFARADTLTYEGLGSIEGTSGLYQLIYDSYLNVTWLDYQDSGNTYPNQVNWATNLTVDFEGQSYTGWSLSSRSQDAYLYNTELDPYGIFPPTVPGLFLTTYWSVDDWNFRAPSPGGGYFFSNAPGYFASGVAVLPGDIATQPETVPEPRTVFLLWPCLVSFGVIRYLKDRAPFG